MTRVIAALGLSVLIAGAFPHEAAAQNTRKKSNSKTITIVNKRSAPTVSLDVRNASLREALARLFYSSNTDFVFEGPIPTGLVTTRIKNQPFDSALRLLLASSDVPLTYSRTGNVYMIRAVRSRPVRENVYVAGNTSEAYVDDGWGNNIANTGSTSNIPVVTPGAPPVYGYEISPGWVGPRANVGGIQFGAPIGGPPVLLQPWGFGYPTVINTGGFGFNSGFNGFNGGFGFTGFNGGFGNFGFPMNAGFGFGNAGSYLRP